MNTTPARPDCGFLLGASAEQLVNVFCRVQPAEAGELAARLEVIGGQLGLSGEELACGLGFNARLPHLPDVLSVLGLESARPLLALRDCWFSEGVDRQLRLDCVLAVHARAVEEPVVAEALQRLLRARLAALEARIDRTVHAPTIERYRTEVRSLYRLGLVKLEFFEERIARSDAGFRALVSEVLLAAETRLVPVGVLLYRSDILPREKQQLVRRGLVPASLLAERLACTDLPPEEQEILGRELRLFQSR